MTFASAAALTLGSHTVPVYEVYKVGENPHWLEGLDLLRALGLPAVLIPHYDNAEGQTHDTRYSYLGEERLSSMERELPEETFVLGVDEHTAVCFDFDAANTTVIGHGGATVRVRGHSTRIEAGETVPLERLLELASELASLPARGVTTTGRCTTGSATTNGAGEDGTAHPVSTIARATSRGKRVALGNSNRQGASHDRRAHRCYMPSAPMSLRSARHPPDPMHRGWSRLSWAWNKSCGRGAPTPSNPTRSTGGV